MEEMKVFVHGRDNLGWSIDSDRAHVERFLIDLGHTLTNSILRADVVHSVWWNQLLTKRNFLVRFKKKIIATATNTVSPDNKDYLRAKRWVTLWIAPSRGQFEIFKNDGVAVAYQPFFVDPNIFRRINKEREELALMLGVGYESIKDRFLIGSFQRDTVAADLRTPKWQKGPERLIEILKPLTDKDRWLLLLAGPRRHFIIEECEKNGIPFYFCGKKPVPGVDDITVNTLNQKKMNLLYNLADCYLVTSKSEGGPKAVPEAGFCKTLVFSTNVGLASDILDKRCIYKDNDTIRAYLSRLIRSEGREYFDTLISSNFDSVNSLCSYEATMERWKQIYEKV